MKKQSFLVGSFILVISVIITKIIGLFFKIPLANILGGTGMGYFSCAYAIFMPVYSVSVTGLPAAVSRMVAENMAFEHYANVRKIRRAAILGFSGIGILSAVAIFALASPFTKYVVENEKSYPALIAIAPCIFFGAVLSVYRGYYEGMRNMFPTAISQIIESFVKLIAGLGFAYGAMMYANDCFEKTGKVFGTVCESLEQAQSMALPYVAAAAIAGVTLSSGVALLYLMIRYSLFSDGITKEMLKGDKTTERKRDLLKQLIRIVIPIALGSIVTNLTSLIDLGTIIRCLNTTIKNNTVYFLHHYRNILDNNMTLSMIPNFIYGSFTGLAITVFNLVPSMTNMFGKGILPNLAEAWAVKDRQRVKKNIHSVISVTGIISIPAGIGMAVLANPILNLLFSSRPEEVMSISRSMSILGIGVIFLSLSIPAFAMLQAIGRADLPVKIMIVGVIIKLIGNVSLIYIPQINVDGAAISTTICYLFICIACQRCIKKLTGVKLDIKRLYLKPGFAGIICGASAYLINEVMTRYISAKIAVLGAIAFAGIIYLITLYLLDITEGKNIKEVFYK